MRLGYLQYNGYILIDWGRLPILVIYDSYQSSVCPGKDALEKMPHHPEAPLRHQHLTELKLEQNLSRRTITISFVFSFHFHIYLFFSSFHD